ncbi:MAG: amidohydrolase family protein [Vicinamibacterales bacterium]
MTRRLRPLATLGIAFGLLAAAPAGQDAPFDLLVSGGRLLDGTGNPWRRADVGIRGDRIVAVGRLAGHAAARVVDARDRVVAPGFIDAHSHALESLGAPDLRDARGLLAQGVTTVIGNPDGGGPVDLAAQAASLADGGIGINAALLIGHGSVRRAVIGSADRQPTAGDLDRMRALVRQAAADGAFGLSSGLFYIPGRYARLEEVIALAREAGGVYTSHIRDEGTYDTGVVASVDEVIRVAEEAGVRGVVSHMKALGPDSWGLSREMIAHIDAARARGVEVLADQYPYDASSTSLAAAVMPGETARSAEEALSGTESRTAFLAMVRENIRRRGGPASIVIASGRGAPGLAGRRLSEIADARGVSPEQAAADIVVSGTASIVSFNMSDEDIDRIMRQPWTMASSDGGLVRPGAGQPHPRSQGAFARRIARYVRDRGVLTLEEAVRTATSLTAATFGLTDRGVIREGALADVIVFDPARVQDRATYEDPFPEAAGIDWVVVNGQVARAEGEFTGARGGRVLRRDHQGTSAGSQSPISSAPCPCAPYAAR